MKRMNAQSGGQDARSGVALITVLIVAMSMAALVAVLAAAGLHRLIAARILGDTIRAKSIAEAGVAHAYLILSTNFESRGGAAMFPETSYGGGTYDVSVVPVGDNGAVITSTGSYNSVVEVAVADVERPASDALSLDLGAYEFMIAVGQDITWTGGGIFHGSGVLVHANGEFRQSGSGVLNSDIESSISVELKGNAGAINGNVFAPEVAGKTGKVSGSIVTTNVPMLGMPDLDLTPFYIYALNHGAVHEGSLTLSGSYSCPGGILWVNGDLTVAGNGTMTGCFIATGDIKVTGGSTFIKVSDYPALVSRDGDIKATGGGDYRSLIYARIGNVEIGGGGAVRGSIVCGGNFKKSGGSTDFYYENVLPVPPYEEDGNAHLALSAWQR